MDFREAAAALTPLFGDTAFELRYALDGRTAVRAFGGPLAPRHAEAVPPPAPWVAAGALRRRRGLAARRRSRRSDPERAGAILERVVERHSAVRLERLAAQRAALEADLLERLTHDLRTDVSTLQTVAEGAAAGVFDAAELGELPAEIAAVGAAAQRRLSAAREVMTALAPAAPATPEPLLETLRAELEAAGAEIVVTDVEGELPRVLVPGAGWSACTRLLAEALGSDDRFAGAAIDVAPHPDGWSVCAGRAGAGQPQPWTGRARSAISRAPATPPLPAAARHAPRARGRRPAGRADDPRRGVGLMASRVIPIALVDDHRMLVLGSARPVPEPPGGRGRRVRAQCRRGARGLSRRATPRRGARCGARRLGRSTGSSSAAGCSPSSPPWRSSSTPAWTSSGSPTGRSTPGPRASCPRATHPPTCCARCWWRRAGKTYTSPAFAARADRRDFAELSPKQLAALRLLAQGLERKQIAERMGIGTETVKSHLSEVRRKLGRAHVGAGGRDRPAQLAVRPGRVRPSCVGHDVPASLPYRETLPTTRGMPSLLLAAALARRRAPRSRPHVRGLHERRPRRGRHAGGRRATSSGSRPASTAARSARPSRAPPISRSGSWRAHRASCSMPVARPTRSS